MCGVNYASLRSSKYAPLQRIDAMKKLLDMHTDALKVNKIFVVTFVLECDA